MAALGMFAPLPARPLARRSSKGAERPDALDLSDRQPGRFDPDGIDPDWLRRTRATNGSDTERAIRRAADLVIAAIALLVTGPLMLVTALVIRCDGKGEAFIRNARVGHDGRIFNLLRLRAAPGSFIHRSRMDEMPQILNVLRGDMAVVGPRPDAPDAAAHWVEAIPHYADRLCVKPGVAGWAQIERSDGPTFGHARARLSRDLYYLYHRTLWLDLRILLIATRIVVLESRDR